VYDQSIEIYESELCNRPTPTDISVLGDSNQNTRSSSSNQTQLEARFSSQRTTTKPQKKRQPACSVPETTAAGGADDDE